MHKTRTRAERSAAVASGSGDGDSPAFGTQLSDRRTALATQTRKARVQILASLLSGFRDFRAYLVASYLWFLNAVLLIGSDGVAHSSAVAAVKDVAGVAGPVALTIAAGIFAYLIGDRTQAAIDLLRSDVQPAFRSQRRLLDDLVLEARLAAENGAGAGSLDEDELANRLAQLREDLKTEIFTGFGLLLGDEPALFARYDTAKTEAHLREAVALPLFAMAVILGGGWLAAVPLVLAIFVGGVRLDVEAAEIVGGALRLRKIQSPGIERFERWATRAGPS
jgi:hypothetical protein